MADETNDTKHGKASFATRNKIILIGIGATALAAAGLWVALTPRGSMDTVMSNTADTGRQVLYWHDPMVPGFKSDKPGKSPFMDMQLVPVYADDAGGAVVRVSPEVVSNLGIRTYQVERAARARRLTVQGYVQRQGADVLVLADVFERDTDWVRAGLPATVRADTLPGRDFAARVESAQPDVGVGSRSLHLVVRLDDPDRALRANTLADVTIHSAPGGKLLAVPREALIRTGTRSAVVLALGEGRFQPVDVVPGADFGDWVEIVTGLRDGDTVVTSGQFLLDSEANVRASFARMEPSAPLHSPGR